MLLQKRKTEFPIWGDVFGNFLTPDFGNFHQNLKEAVGTLPAVNIKENESQYDIEMAVPGKKKEDFTIDLNDNLLTISSEHQDSKEEKEGNYTRKEYSYQSFKRSFRLPDQANQELIQANYSDGILKISIPKIEEKKNGIKTISIS